MSMVSVYTYNPVATEHHAKYHNMSPQFKKSFFLKCICAYLVLMELHAAGRTFCIFCSQSQGELFDMQQRM
jgi:hypothetical protein